MHSKTSTPGPDGFKKGTAAFFEWFTSLPGATFADAIEMADLRHRGAGRGIIATQDIPAETTIFAVPRQAIINVQTSTLSQELPELFESRGNEDYKQALDS